MTSHARTHAVEPELIADGVCFRYGEGALIGPVSLSLGAGLHRLSGANGAGKSTLLRCFCGDLVPLSGSVSVNGRDPVADVVARVLIGHAPYPDDLPDFLTVSQLWRGLAVMRGCLGWRGGEIVEAFQLPSQLRIAHASAGQRRKAGLLACLVGDPAILLLDEPWAAIDAAAIDTVTSLIDARRSQHVMLFTTHGDCPLIPDSTITLT